MIAFIKNNAALVVDAVQIVAGMCNIWCILFAAVCFILLSAGLYTLAKHRHLDRPWLAWLPIGNLWILGCLADQYRTVVQGKEKVNSKDRQLWLSVICAVLLIAIVVLMMSGITYALEEIPIMTVSKEMLEQLDALTGDQRLEGYLKLMADMVEADAAVTRTVNTGLIVVCVLLVAGIAAALWLAVEKYRALYFLYRSCLPRHAVWLLAVSILPGAEAVTVLICRKQNQGMPHDKKGRIQVI